MGFAPEVKAVSVTGSRTSRMPERLFCYGTLQLAAVMEAVTGKRFPAEPAVLTGYACRRVRGECYPGLAAAAGATTTGVLYRELDRRSLALLDRFEGPLYRRSSVSVKSRGAIQPAEVYLVPERHEDQLTREDWDLELFGREHLAAFLSTYRGFVRVKR